MMGRREWAQARDELVRTVTGLGFSEELGNEIAKNLGSPKAMHRMQVYLENVKPNKVEIVVDEMLSICSEINAWREKKAGVEANAKFNEIMYYGLDSDDD